MSKEDKTIEAIDRLASRVRECYEQGNALSVEVHNVRPTFKIHSLRPLVYEKFGRFRNKPPLLLGACAIESLVWVPNSADWIVPYAVLPTETTRLGAQLPVPLLNSLSELVGLPATWERWEKSPNI